MPLRPEVVPPTASDSFPHSTDQEEDQHHVFLHPPLLHQILVHVSLLHWSSLQRPKDVPGPHHLQESAKLCQMPVFQYFRNTPGTSQRSASPLLSADCNPALETETCNQLAREIGRLPPTSIQIRKPTLPFITSSNTLPDLVGPRSFLFFSHQNLDHTFLLAEDWRETPHFSTLKSAISNLYPVSDSSEIALAMATSFNGRITRDEESYQDIMLVVAAHRKKYGFKTKEDLKNFV